MHTPLYSVSFAKAIGGDAVSLFDGLLNILRFARYVQGPLADQPTQAIF